jgi:hypothetical protein
MLGVTNTCPIFSLQIAVMVYYLSRPWHVASNPKVSYPAREIKLNDYILPLKTEAETIGREAKFHNMSINYFTHELRKLQARVNIKVFQFVEVSRTDFIRDEKRIIDPQIKPLYKAFVDVSRSEFPDGLPPKRLTSQICGPWN